MTWRRAAVWFVAFTALAAFAGVWTRGLIDAPIHSDGYSYYVYLPSWFLHHDPSLQGVADDCCGGVLPAFTSIIRWPETGRWVNPHPIGVAILMMPAFAAAHLLTRWSNLPPDGFSLYYQLGAGLSGLLAVVFGLAILGRLLSRYFPDRVVAVTLLALAFGTNLFHYATYDATFSHAFSFFLIAALLELTDRWYVSPDGRTSLWLAVVAALIVLARHTNAIVLLVVPLGDPRMFIRHWRQVTRIALIGAFCLLPQLVVYKQATGHWFVSVYSELGTFDPRAPHALDVLFSVQKGLFFWSPLLLLAAAGCLTAHPLVRRWRFAFAAVFAVNLYLAASWFAWQFGASFGHRGFTDILPFAGVLLAASFDWVGRRPRLLVFIAMLTMAIVALSTFQTLQYWSGMIPQVDMTWTQYRAVFLRWP
jgi:hypothetical protein